MKFKSVLLALLFMSATAGAVVVTESFDSRAGFASGTAVWNQALGKVHPTLHVTNYNGGPALYEFSIGDGAHGAFEPATYSAFSPNLDVPGKKIYLDTTVFPALNVTRFELAAGWTLIPTGANPLIIYSQSTVDIQGIIDCTGDAGGASFGATPGAGGVGHCGGAIGGGGGAVGFAGQNGADASAGVTGGRAGNFVGAAGVGGGGGGGWSGGLPRPAPGTGATGAGGQAGVYSGDPEFALPLAAGSGGGGGSGTTTAAGGGGGGGGGTVIIHAAGTVNLGSATDPTIGFVYVNGGAGGGSNTGSGAGGGGAGGSVQIFAGDTLNIYNTAGAGASQAEGGAGGMNSAAGVGGDGGVGRSWLSAVNFNYTGHYSPAEEPPNNGGWVEFNSASQYVITKPVDTMGLFGKVTSLSVTPVSPDLTLELAGSDDDFAADDTGWSTSTAAVAGKRFLRMRIRIATSNVLAPVMADSAVFVFEPGLRENFDFKSAGCGRIKGSPPPPQSGLVLLLLPLLLGFLKFQAQRQQGSG